MRDYCLPNSWYEPDDSYENCCQECQENEKIRLKVRDSLKSLIEELYSKESLNLDKVEQGLDDLCAYFDSELPATSLSVQRKKEESPVLQDWVQFNTSYMKQLTI